jgi:foldase protein PrsA
MKLKNVNQILFLGLVVSAFIFSACSKKSDKILVKIGGEKITVSEFESLIENAPYNLQQYLATDNGRRHYLDALIKEKMALIAAKKQGIQKRPEVKKQLAELEKRAKENYKRLKDEVIMNEALKERVVLTQNEVADYYQKHKEEFEKPVELKVSHILLSAEGEAQAILMRVKKGEDFAKLAKEFSIDKVSASKGGDIGFFGRRQYVKDFEDAAYNLKKIGDISDVVKTPLGYHVIKLTDRKQLKPQKMEDAENEIKQILQKEKLDQWLEDIAKKYKPIINEELLSKNFIKEKGNEK